MAFCLSTRDPLLKDSFDHFNFLYPNKQYLYFTENLVRVTENDEHWKIRK